MNDFIFKARKDAAEWALGLLKRDPSTWVILDTETTGLGNRDEIVQIAAIDGEGKVLIGNTLIKPTIAIPESAQRIHGISNEMVAGAPRFSEVWNLVYQFTKGKLLVIYNADYDLRMFEQSAWALDYAISWKITAYACAMHWYAAWFGEWDDYHESFRWQRLPSGDHSALGDCKATLRLIRKMAEG